MTIPFYSADLSAKEISDRRQIRVWLLFICFIILCMVVVGGATRLTESGLSITEWKPIHGAIPPLNAQEWAVEFEKYRQIPQYKLLNDGMSLGEFKNIFWWEWGHRLLGRVIGLFFFVPLVWFWARGQVSSWLKPRLVVAFALGGLQGAIGWWMVASGLVNRVDVSQYRLAIHLSVACILFAYLYYFAGVLKQRADLKMDDWSEFGKGLGTAYGLVGLVLFQLFLGGLVAGLNAGLTFNTWPLMDGQIIPSGLFVMSPAWANFFENVMMVQFQHRMVAYALVLVVFLQGFYLVRANRDDALKRNASWLMVAIIVQVVLGVLTLLGMVPMDRALAHQAMALIVLALAVEQVCLLRREKEAALR
ncbi:COX15/CtaA family protein [Pseudovibrio sp. Tun.PSC04-5.I4]|uniref:COX15/CtaA family protein n=1 Tax=Pseudovibrio sp. Tun.PSC04-5.I4 TaxID=1798213 RepID=UPI0008805940|nr:COX15/CtaA family protein [Pseudovibrio sp. Tun.PSC04-5.I4]SDR12315.1 cytochrome c oxidase assembly protein subunit 15 [Pseudovibrio sp. Tun.PSC04-5.I4]